MKYLIIAMVIVVSSYAVCQDYMSSYRNFFSSVNYNFLNDEVNQTLNSKNMPDLYANMFSMTFGYYFIPEYIRSFDNGIVSNFWDGTDYYGFAFTTAFKSEGSNEQFSVRYDFDRISFYFGIKPELIDKLFFIFNTTINYNWENLSISNNKPGDIFSDSRLSYNLTRNSPSISFGIGLTYELLIQSRVYDFAEKNDYLEIGFLANYHSKFVKRVNPFNDFLIDGINYSGLDMYPMDGFSMKFQLGFSTEVKKFIQQDK